MKKICRALILILLWPVFTTYGQEYRLPLYNDVIPNSKQTASKELSEKRDIIWITNVKIPDMAVNLPTKRFATGQAVVICPGGGYGGLAYMISKAPT